MAKQTFTTGQVLTAAQMTSLQQTAMLGGAASAKTASYTLVAADAGTAISMSNASATTITVNTALFAAGDTVQITNLGAGVCTITAGTATVNSSASLALAQYESGTLDFTSTSAAIFIKGAGAAASGATFSGVSLTKSVSQTLSNNTQTAITFDTESLDTNSYHSNVTNTSRITIPAGKAGKYLVFGHIAFNQNATSFRRITFYKNGASFAGFYTGTTSGNFPTILSYIAIMDLAENDYVEMFGVQNSGGDLTVRGNDETAGITAFAAFLIGA